ncbi:MAG: 1,2-phenylacetyl-CoA epoxidase subunit PaaC [Pseudomonadota bacterium]
MDARIEFLHRMGDTALILGHRVSEWCGHGPVLEEDIALANTALDLIGQSQMWLTLAGESEGAARTADDLAFHRDAHEFRNLLIVERPNGDFGHTILRQFLFDVYHFELLTRLGNGQDAEISAVAQKAVKEVSYHLERSSDLVVRLGDGSDESHRRMQSALDQLWPYTGEMLMRDKVDEAMAERGILPDPVSITEVWNQRVASTLDMATLAVPEHRGVQKGGKDGRMHSEHLGHLLATMQILPRSYPDAQW